MAIADAQLFMSDAQVVTTSAASTNVIDIGVARNIFDGQPVAVVLGIISSLTGTTPTLTVAVQCDDNAGFASPTTLSSTVLTPAAVLAGTQFILPISVGANVERYVRVNYTTGGTSPSVTLDAYLQPLDFISKQANYPDAITIS